MDLFWVSNKSGNKKFVFKLSGIWGRFYVFCVVFGFIFVLRICFKRLFIVVLFRIFDLFFSFIFGIRIFNSLYILLWRFLSCCVDCVSLIYCFFLFSLLNLMIKLLLMFFIVVLLLLDSFFIGFFFGGGVEGGELMKIIFFFMCGFCGIGCLMMLLLLLCVFLFLFIKGLKIFYGLINYCLDLNMRKIKCWEVKINIYLF